MIVVTTPTGSIGSQVVKQLLAADAAVRVIVRDPSKLEPEVKRRVEVVQGSSDDEQVLSHALEGAQSLFWVVPPGYQTNFDADYYLRFTQPACNAIQSQRVKRVVAVSALGRGLGMRAGPASASFAMDTALEQTGVNYRALWCPSFMENTLRQVAPLKQHGTFSLPSRPDLKTPLASTRDIASSGVKLLLDTAWTGQGGLAVLGPEDLSKNDMAAIMTDVLGKPIRFQQLSNEAYKAQLMNFGSNETCAHGVVEMFIAKSEGLDNAEPRTAENTTPTSFREWCEEVLKPAMLK